jgi:four helix bundle protein
MDEKRLETLEAWCKARDFAVRVYREVLPFLPKAEKWSLDQQLRRASVSIPANLAEGYGRYYYQDNIRFCHIARGSQQEVVSHLVLARDFGYLPEPGFSSLRQDAETLLRLINGYIGYLKRTKLGEDEPGARLGVRESLAPYDLELSGEAERSSMPDTEPDKPR